MKIKGALIILVVLVAAVYLYSKRETFGWRGGQSPRSDRPPGMTGGQPGGGPGS